LAPPTRPRYGSLVPLLDVPASVAAGSTLDYVVDLTNPTQKAVALDPCPVYGESLETVEAVYLLNCGGVSVPAGGSVRFEMHLALPISTPRGPGLVQWAMSRA
jgi:hypothetical protein